MGKKKIHDKLELRASRRELWSNATPAEAYIVDFYCASEGLIVELDGQVHMNPTAEEYDKNRDAFLEGMGFVVIRFENKMIFDVLPSVLMDIGDHFKENRR